MKLVNTILSKRILDMIENTKHSALILCIILTLGIGIHKAFAQTSILDQAKQAIEDMEYSEALKLLDSSLAIHPTWEEHYFYRSVVLQKLRRYEESLGDINTFLTIHPTNAEAVHNKATILSDLRQFQESLIYHQKAIELKPNEAQYYATAGIAAFDLNQFDLAEMYLKGVHCHGPKCSHHP